jgi:c-di-GMP phosphodiesterase
MRPPKHKRTSAYYALTIFWLVLTLFLLVIVYNFNHQKEQLKTQQLLFFVSDGINNRFDSFISELKDAVYAMPVLENKFDRCTPQLKKGLLTAVFNNPNISGISIKNKENKVLCSSLSNVLIASDVPIKKNGLLGPVKISENQEPAFIIQQRLGTKIIDVYVLQSILELVLSTSSPYAKAIALFDTSRTKAVIQIEKNAVSGKWVPSNTKNFVNIDTFKNHPDLTCIAKLNEVDDFQVVLAVDPKIVSRLTLWNKIINLSLALITSVLIYLYLRIILTRRFSLKRAIENALKYERFFPVYQPIKDLSAKRYCGVEVLMRWRTDNNEIIMPDSFIEEAEQYNIIVPITLQMAKQALKECKPILEKEPSFHLGFNVSTKHFQSDSFFEELDKLRVSLNIKPEQILIEMTERDLISQSDTDISDKMKRLRDKGYALAIDDFGTGHASISYLRHFPFNYLKIDKLFIRSIGTGAVTEALNHSIILLAKNLNYNIIAEGVESEVQLNYLKDNGVHYIQGWIFAKAMPIKELMDFFTRSEDE